MAIKSVLDAEGLGHLFESTEGDSVDDATLTCQKAAVKAFIWKSLSVAQTNYFTGEESEPSEMWGIPRDAHIVSPRSPN